MSASVRGVVLPYRGRIKEALEARVDLALPQIWFATQIFTQNLVFLEALLTRVLFQRNSVR